MTSYNYCFQRGFFPPSASGGQFSNLIPTSAGVNLQSNQPFSQPYQPFPTPSAATAPQKPATDFYLKIFNPTNKKEYKLYTVRGLSPDIDSPDKLKRVLATQYGDLLPQPDDIEVGYFNQSKKIWISNRLDLNDVWALVGKGEKITLWCMGVTESATGMGQRKRPCEDIGSNSHGGTEPGTKRAKKLTTTEQKKALVEDYEQKLQEKHQDKYTRFQIKLWAEMLATGVHTDLDTPPAASMFGRDRHAKRQSESSLNESVLSQMMTMMNSVCQALIPNRVETERKVTISPNLSPMKRAELRSTYLKQLGELRQLLDQDVLTEEEYEEQRGDLVDSMRQLKDRKA